MILIIIIWKILKLPHTHTHTIKINEFLKRVEYKVKTQKPVALTGKI